MILWHENHAPIPVELATLLAQTEPGGRLTAIKAEAFIDRPTAGQVRQSKARIVENDQRGRSML